MHWCSVCFLAHTAITNGNVFSNCDCDCDSEQYGVHLKIEIYKHLFTLRGIIEELNKQLIWVCTCSLHFFPCALCFLKQSQNLRNRTKYLFENETFSFISVLYWQQDPISVIVKVHTLPQHCHCNKQRFGMFYSKSYIYVIYKIWTLFWKQ